MSPHLDVNRKFINVGYIRE